MGEISEQIESADAVTTGAPSAPSAMAPAKGGGEAGWRRWAGTVARIAAGAMLRFFLYGAGMGVVGLAAAALLFHAAVAGALDWPAGLEATLVLLAYLIYPLAGALGGLVLAASRTMVVHAGELEQHIHEMSEPIIAELARRLPRGDAHLTIPEFRALLDDVIRDWGRYNKPRWSILSPAAWLSAGVRRVALLALRWTLVRDFLEVHEKRRMAHVTTGSLLTWGRERAVGRVTDVFRVYALVLRIVTGVVLLVLWFGPAAAAWVF